MKAPFALPLLAFATLLPASSTAGAAEADAYRGERLYDANCGRCHSVRMHERSPLKVKSREELRAQVERWAIHADRKFTPDEIEDLVTYLERWHYQLGGSK